MDKIEFIKFQGWEFKEYWSNREVYQLSKYPKAPYALFMHQNEIGLIRNDSFLYYDLKESDIIILTNAICKVEEITNNSENHTAKEFFDAYKALRTILRGFEKRVD